MSYRGWPQYGPDHALIASHPDIFSSFYSAPLPHLEREFLKELRDFLLNGQRAFRRLLLGLHQDSGNIVDAFQLWLEWRKQNEIDFSSGDRTAYYADRDFTADFLRFVRLRYLPASQAPLALTALVAYEAALLGEDLETGGAKAVSDQRLQVEDELLSPDSRPQLFPGVKKSSTFLPIIRKLCGGCGTKRRCTKYLRGR
jgi:hypothetical protein